MIKLIAIALIVSACTDDATTETPACNPADRACTAAPTDCNVWRQLAPVTTDAAEIALAGEVTALDDQDQYVCAWDMPPVSDVTWSTQPRKRTDTLELGAVIVTSNQPFVCAWQPAIAVRDSYLGQCDAEVGQ